MAPLPCPLVSLDLAAAAPPCVTPFPYITPTTGSPTATVTVKPFPSIIPSLISPGGMPDVFSSLLSHTTLSPQATPAAKRSKDDASTPSNASPRDVDPLGLGVPGHDPFGVDDSHTEPDPAESPHPSPPSPPPDPPSSSNSTLSDKRSSSFPRTYGDLAALIVFLGVCGLGLLCWLTSCCDRSGRWRRRAAREPRARVQEHADDRHRQRHRHRGHQARHEQERHERDRRLLRRRAAEAEAQAQNERDAEEAVAAAAAAAGGEGGHDKPSLSERVRLYRQDRRTSRVQKEERHREQRAREIVDGWAREHRLRNGPRTVLLGDPHPDEAIVQPPEQAHTMPGGWEETGSGSGSGNRTPPPRYEEAQMEALAAPGREIEDIAAAREEEWDRERERQRENHEEARERERERDVEEGRSDWETDWDSESTEFEERERERERGGGGVRIEGQGREQEQYELSVLDREGNRLPARW